MKTKTVISKIWHWTDWIFIGTALAMICRLFMSCQVQRPGIQMTGSPGIYRVQLQDRTWIVTDDTTLKGGVRP